MSKSLPTLCHEWILWTGDGTGLPDAILHIHAGLAILLVVRLASRRSLATFVPFLFVAGAEAANEVMDYSSDGMRWADTLADLGNTLFWSFVIRLGVRWRPMITATADTGPSDAATVALLGAAGSPTDQPT